MNYEQVLQDCLTRVLEEGASLNSVIREHPAWSERLEEDIATVLWLQERGEAYQPRPDFVPSTQPQLIEKLIASKLAKKRFFPRSWIPGRQGFRFASILAVLVFIFMLGSGLIVGADSAHPGDGLYFVRKASEAIQLTLVRDETRRAELHLQFAQEYLVSCAILVSQGRLDDAYLALREYYRHVAGTGRLLVDLSEFNGENFNHLLSDFNLIFLQDLEVFQTLLPGAF